MTNFSTRLQAALDQHQQHNPTPKSLAAIGNRSELLKWLFRYVTFNSIFAGGVSNLAGEVHTRTQLFRDNSDEWSLFADRSANIAARIFFAAEDEYSNHQQTASTQIHHHRYLAQYFLRSVAQHWGISAADFQQQYGYMYESLENTLQSVLQGYCVNQVNSEEKLLRGIGFHLGSEHLADGEFCALDAYLREKETELVEMLRKEGRPNAYTWVAVHTTVEAEHAQHAFLAAVEAARFFAGSAGVAQAETWILEGVAQFAETQRHFFADVLV